MQLLFNVRRRDIVFNLETENDYVYSLFDNTIDGTVQLIPLHVIILLMPLQKIAYTAIVAM